MKRTVKIQVEIDMDGEACKQWSEPEDYFTHEVDEVLERAGELIRGFKYTKDRQSDGTTESEGSQYHIRITKSKKPVKIFYQS